MQLSWVESASNLMRAHILIQAHTPHRGASEGKGLGNKFLAHIREVDAILHVVRCFSGESVTHVDGTVDPVRDAQVIETELLLKDAETIDRALEKLRYEGT